MIDLDIPSYERKYQYSSERLMPYLFFFKYMARKPDDSKSSGPRIHAWIPDTIIFNDGELPAMWFFTAKNGCIYRNDSFSKRTIF